MKVIYHCPHQSFAAVTAAAIHLGMLAPDKKPSSQTILEIVDHFAWQGAARGIIYPVGTDTQNNQVYLLPRGTNATIVCNVITGLTKVLGKKSGDLTLIDTDLLAGQPEKILLYCLRMAAPGLFPFLEIDKTYFALVRLVKQQLS